ncbi:MAG: adenosylcobalamin-dependent ribonucleoside-diphosphate reductase [Planctomycetes bacterium]|nr:adenosylcobalamin-dependent ribonucleoside-diphosphate reductase [Planctomycetota bacterium]
MESLTPEARRVLEARYLLRDRTDRVVETPEEMLARVARAVADAELGFGSGREAAAWEERFFEAMANLEFLPNSPTLMNAGTEMGQLAACFVLPVPDSIPGIFGAIGYTAQVQKTGGGVGMTFEDLRPRGDAVGEIRGGSSGPVSFMRIFDTTAQEIKQGGRRRGAMMGILPHAHPDIVEFIEAKRTEGELTNFNLSVSVDDAFFDALDRGGDIDLINPRTGARGGRIAAPDLWRRIGEAAHASGDPGLIYLDRIARDNPTPDLGMLRATNPCGEIPLLPFEACNLGSIDVGKLARAGAFDETRFRSLVATGVRFLDDTIAVSRYPIAEIAENVARTRKIGLGVMGFADLLLALRVPYHSDEALRMARRIAGILREEADAASRRLAAERGPFPAWSRSIYRDDSEPPRNATRTAIAPTGTISLIAGASSSIEPLFALAFERVGALGGTADLGRLHPLVDAISREGKWSDAEREEVVRTGSAQGLARIPSEMRALLKTAVEIPPSHHIAIQAAFQERIDNAVSKTINLPGSATIDETLAAFRMARDLGCKGITIFREGARRGFLRRGIRPAADQGPQSCACVVG